MMSNLLLAFSATDDNEYDDNDDDGRHELEDDYMICITIRENWQRSRTTTLSE